MTTLSDSDLTSVTGGIHVPQKTGPGAPRQGLPQTLPLPGNGPSPRPLPFPQPMPNPNPYPIATRK
jgi:hypothetical protein